MGFIRGEDEISLGIDEHSFRHQEFVHTMTEVRKRKMLLGFVPSRSCFHTI
jgi:hypothetical protein